MEKAVLIPIPSHDFDTTEVVTSWLHLRKAGYPVIFATPDGKRGYTDPFLLTGVLFGKLGAKKEIVASYHEELEKDDAFLHPISYAAIDAGVCCGLLLPGGHAKGMRAYLESRILQRKVLDFWHSGNPVAAICHGSIVLARTIDPQTNRPVIYEKKVTSLTRQLERTAFYMTAWARGRYYRTYPEYVQDEVVRNLKTKANYQPGPFPARPFVVKDGLLLTARWPNDAALFADTFIGMLAKKAEGGTGKDLEKRVLR